MASLSSVFEAIFEEEEAFQEENKNYQGLESGSDSN